MSPTVIKPEWDRSIFGESITLNGVPVDVKNVTMGMGTAAIGFTGEEFEAFQARLMRQVCEVYGIPQRMLTHHVKPTRLRELAPSLSALALGELNKDRP